MSDDISNKKKVANTTPNTAPATAVALKYDLNKTPRVVAKGEGHVADKIIDIAEEHGVTLYQDSELVKLLSRIEIDEEIPSSLYQAVAVVLAFVFQLNGLSDEKAAEIKHARSRNKTDNDKKQ